jgi:hypothetical protein
MKSYVYWWQYLADFFSEWEMFQAEVAEKTKTHILCSITLTENRVVGEVMWKNTCGRAIETTNDNIVQRMGFVCWMTKAADTLRILKTSLLSTATTVTRTRFSVRLYVHCLSFLQSTVTSSHFEGFRAENFVVFSAVMSNHHPLCFSWGSAIVPPGHSCRLHRHHFM